MTRMGEYPSYKNEICMKKIIILFIGCFVVLTGFVTTAQPRDSSVYNPDTLVGIASFYSTNLDSTLTATGEYYTHGKLTAASNQYKLNTWVRVTNLRNGRSVVVRINDRMHKRMQAKGRVIDLSRSAAKILGFMKGGLTRVQLVKVPRGTKK
jgi:rare lipoprotein A